MSRLQDISKMNLADLDRPGQTGREEDQAVDREEVSGQEIRYGEETSGWDSQGQKESDGNRPEGGQAEGEESVPAGSGDLSQAGPESASGDKVEAGKEDKAPKKMMEPQGQHYYVDAELSENDLVSFMLNHSYRQPLMIFVTIIGIIWPIMAWYRGQSMVIPIIGAACILILMPGTTYLQGKKAKKTMKIYQEVFHYMFDEWGMHLEVSGEAIDVEWKRVIKVLSLKSLLVLYTGKNNAFLVPVKDMGPREEEIKAFIYRMTGKK